MTPEKQQITIAEVCRWKRGEVSVYDDRAGEGVSVAGWHGPQGQSSTRPPDYLNDLNAVHEAEKVLKGELRSRYIGHLAEIVIRDGGEQVIIFATATQRAEAFLKTIGKWEE